MRLVCATANQLSILFDWFFWLTLKECEGVLYILLNVRFYGNN